MKSSLKLSPRGVCVHVCVLSFWCGSLHSLADLAGSQAPVASSSRWSELSPSSGLHGGDFFPLPLSIWTHCYCLNCNSCEISINWKLMIRRRERSLIRCCCWPSMARKRARAYLWFSSVNKLLWFDLGRNWK